jgi:hypothetical protein
MAGNAAQDEQVGQDIDHVDRLELPADTDRQAFMGELVHHVEHPLFAAIMDAVLDEVVAPDVIGVLGAEANTRPVRQPESPSFWLFGGHFILGYMRKKYGEIRRSTLHRE